MTVFARRFEHHEKFCFVFCHNVIVVFCLLIGTASLHAKHNIGLRLTIIPISLLVVQT